MAMQLRPFHPRLEDLPRILPVFPLAGTLLLPEGTLPLNVFEPRYLSLVEDSLAWGRMFGIIQPSGIAEAGAATADPLYETGCAGRITSFAETDDGRFYVTLLGVCRFRVAEEVEGTHGYRRVAADWDGFRGDLEDHPEIDIDRRHLLGALKHYVKVHDLKLDWKSIEHTGSRTLVTSLSMACPFEPREKQALLECVDDVQRADILTALLEMSVAEHQGNAARIRQ